MKYYILVMLLLTGCSSPADVAFENKKGALRHDLFVECMELSAQNGRKSDDDVHKIVDSCNQHSLYLANSMMNK